MLVKILVVDDEPDFERLIRQRLRKKIRAKAFDLAFAQDGLDALEKLEQDPSFDIVLSDINMPRMDGLSLLSELKKVRREVMVIMVSAYGDMNNIRAAMNSGAFDFVTKPINFQDLETTIDKTIQEIKVKKQAAMAQELEIANEQLRAVDQMKSEFFTNISHEFRTPLTVINGMVDQIREKPERWFPQGLEMIKRNGNNLLNLVNQILDLAKLESGSLQLNLIQSDVIPYLKYIVESFHSLASAKQIHLACKNDQKRLVMDYDPARLLRIVSNVLSNAIKFTPNGGKISLELSIRPRESLSSLLDIGPATPADYLSLEIKDTGIGIPPDRLPLIFDRFYQVDGSPTRPGEGTGIGLALVKKLITLMDGGIEVSSIEGEGTVFNLVFPIRRLARVVEATYQEDVMEIKSPSPTIATWNSTEMPPIGAQAEREGGTSGQAEERPTLLIADDNPDVIDYMRACLESEYELLVARDGQEGIDMAIEEVPDLIVSDVMMPRKTGIELCQTLKADDRTSHIPIVLLTAKVDQDSKVQGLAGGADAYLAKPFDQRELFIRLEQLLNLRRKLQQRYSNLDELDHAEGNRLPREDSFLLRVKKQVEEQLDDENLSIAGLARSVGISRAQLHNKIKALTGYSPSVFVRNIRLYQAKKILLTTDLNISQVAYEVGFRDPAYFTRTFTKEFGKSPKEMRS